MKDIDRSIIYLMRLIVGAVERSVNKHARLHDLRIEEIWVLFRLMAKDQQTVGELAGETGIDRTTLSRLLTQMQAKGLLRRQRLAADQRTVRISLTGKGRTLGEARHPTFRDYEGLVARGLGATEMRQLKSALLQMVANLAEIEEEEPAKGKPAAEAGRRRVARRG